MNLRIGVLLPLLAACQALQPQPAPLPEELKQSVEQLYEAFDFDAGGGADWNSLEKLFLEEACIVNPFADGAPAQVSSRADFLREFQAYVRSESVRSTGLHERILAVRGECRGNIAHTWVEFEGFLPATGELKTRGVDSIQWVLDSTRWRVASFTTHYRR
jgi:hypothetical protein